MPSPKKKKFSEVVRGKKFYKLRFEPGTKKANFFLIFIRLPSEVPKIMKKY